MVSNPNYYSQSTTSSFNQIEDGVDFPHTGIIKSLSDGLGQNYAISGFDITIDSATQIDVGAGVIFRDGKKVSISAVNNLALGRTTASENSYHLVSVASNDAIVIRSPSAQDKVPDYTAGDTIIAVVTHNGSNPMPIQYLTVNKTEHSVSVGYDNSGYTEAMSIEGNATRTLFKNKVADADIRFVLADNTADERFEIYSDDDSDGDEGDTALFTVDGLGATTITGATTLSSIAACGSDTDKFLVSDSGVIKFRTGTEVASDIGALTGTLGIANNNILQANANLADDDFLRVDGTQIEGRTAAETLSDIAAMPLAGGTFTGAVTVNTGQTFRTPRLPTVSVSASTTLTEATHAGAYLICAGNVTLPATSSAGEHYTILNTTGGNITVGRNGNNINNAASDITVGTFNGVTCIAIGGNDWIALGV